MKQVVITPPVEIALRSLDSENRRRIHAWFDHLKNWDGDQFVRSRSHKLEGLPDVYVLRTSTDLRIFFRIDGDTITILDVAKRSTIMTSGHIPGAE
jgi:mRNA-degrading endonuclease RelE of RelBE toxin-antitoxin system